MVSPAPGRRPGAGPRGGARTTRAALKARIRSLYRQLLESYGPQGWWPIPGRARRRGFDERGYHPGDYRTPSTAADRFEVIMGAVLTQNTAWTNVERALAQVRQAGVRLPHELAALSHAALARLVRSSGYFNQKARKLRSLASRFAARGALRAAPTREALLAEWGVGPETADSILLYAFQAPVFVVDTYTRRIASRIGLVQGKEPYGEIQALFHSALEPSAPLFNEYHALIVEHAKQHCRTRPECGSCPVRRCGYRDTNG